MYKRISQPATCFFCGKRKEEFTYFPSDQPGHRNLLCDDCAETHLTAEAYFERTGKKSYKENSHGQGTSSHGSIV